jgi:hypothetical protein
MQDWFCALYAPYICARICNPSVCAKGTYWSEDDFYNKIYKVCSRAGCDTFTVISDEPSASIFRANQEPVGYSEEQIHYPDWTMSYPRRQPSNVMQYFYWIRDRSVGSLVNMRGVELASDVCRNITKNNACTDRFIHAHHKYANTLSCMLNMMSMLSLHLKCNQALCNQQLVHRG